MSSMFIVSKVGTNTDTSSASTLHGYEEDEFPFTTIDIRLLERDKRVCEEDQQATLF